MRNSMKCLLNNMSNFDFHAVAFQVFCMRTNNPMRRVWDCTRFNMSSLNASRFRLRLSAQRKYYSFKLQSYHLFMASSTRWICAKTPIRTSTNGKILCEKMSAFTVKRNKHFFVVVVVIYSLILSSSK